MSRALHVLHQQLNGGLVIQDHLRARRRLALRHLPMLDERPRVEARTGAALQLAGRPRQVNQQAIEDGPAVSASGRA